MSKVFFRVRVFSFVLILCLLPIMSSCKKSNNDNLQKSIAVVRDMPERTVNFEAVDWGWMGLETDRVLFDFAKNPEYIPVNYDTCYPIGYWDDMHINTSKRIFGLPSYFGHVNKDGVGTMSPGSQEGITTMAAVLSGTYMGIDKSKQVFTGEDNIEYTYNFVSMMEGFYNISSGFVLNRVSTGTGATFWYEIWPQIQFCKLYALYPQEIWMRPIILEGADKWLSAIPYMQDAEGNLDLEMTSFDFATMKPYNNGSWQESPVGGVAYIFYYAYMLTGEQKYLDACIRFMDYIDISQKNPYYEILQDYLPVVASILNVRHGKSYDIQKFINFNFDGDGDYRAMARIANDTWGNYGAHGLTAFEYDDETGVGYAFAMNTYHAASTLAQTVKYDSRFANDIGKYFMHLANSARVFFGQQLPADNQSMSGEMLENWKAADPYQVLSYEGTNKNNRRNNPTAPLKEPYAYGDPSVHGWGKSDIGIYGAAHLGFFAGITRQTNVKEIWEIDLSKTDQLAYEGDFQKYLYYNPYGSAKKVTINVESPFMIYDTVSKEILKDNVSGKFSFSIPSRSSVVLALLPVGANIDKDNKGIITANGKYLAREQLAVEILSPTEVAGTVRRNITVTFDYTLPTDQKIKSIKAYLNNTEVAFSAENVKSFEIDTRKVVNGKCYVTVVVETDKGIVDSSSKRVRVMNL